MRAIKQKARKVDGQCSDMWYCLIATSSPKEDGEKFLQYRSLQGPFAGGSSLQEVRNDRTGEQDVRTMQGWCSAPQGRATRRAPATGPPMGGRRGAPLRRHFRFKNFREALHFVNKVGELAEEQGHHPDIYLGWGRVEVLVWTHKINGLTESDFIFAAKVDTL